MLHTQFHSSPATPLSSRFPAAVNAVVAAAGLMFLACLTLAILPSKPLAAQEATNTHKQPSLEDYPKVVAVVNGSTISRDKLADDCMRRFGPVVIDNLLNKWLIIQACEAKGISITQNDVNEEIARTASKFGITTKMFLDNLESERDITPEHYASEIIWPMLALRALASEKIAVTAEEIDQVIQSEYGPRVQVQMIASKTAARAQELHAQVTAAPETFGRVATEHSDEAVSASVGGLLPPIRRYSGDDILENIAFQLGPEQISPVFELGGSHIFLKCLRHFPASLPQPQLLPTIQARIHDQIRDKRLGAASNEIFTQLQEQSKVVTVTGNKELEQKYPGVAAYINGQPVPMTHLAYECVNRHGRQILRGEIDRMLLKQQLKASKKVIIQPDIDAEIARAADTSGYINSDGSANVEAWLKSIVEEDGVTIDLYVDDAVWPSVALKKLVEDEVVITDEDLQKGYESNYGPRAEVLAVVLSSQRTAQDVFSKARLNLNEKTFGELAAEYSVEPVSRSNFGKIPAMRRHSGRATLEEVAFSLKPGEMSGVIAWGDQYAILYKQGETTPIIRDFDAVKSVLEDELREKKLRMAMSRKLDQIKRAAQIDNLLEGTAQNGSNAAAAAPPAGVRR